MRLAGRPWGGGFFRGHILIGIQPSGQNKDVLLMVAPKKHLDTKSSWRWKLLQEKIHLAASLGVLPWVQKLSLLPKNPGGSTGYDVVQLKPRRRSVTVPPPTREEGAERFLELADNFVNMEAEPKKHGVKTLVYLDPPSVSNFSPQVCFWWLKGLKFQNLGGFR